MKFAYMISICFLICIFLNKKMEINAKIKKLPKHLSIDELNKLSKEDLIAKIQSLEAHNMQLQNIISKSNNGTMKQVHKNIDYAKYMFRHIFIKLFYFGWDCQGFATQEDTINTIEYYLFDALTKTCLIKDRSSSNYHRCGRTDKGVSSFGQTISIDVRSNLSNPDDSSTEIDYCKVLNRVLPDFIKCIAWAPVPSDFSSRFNCTSRTYRYYFPKGNLDINRMREASKFFIGSHDFRNFCKMDVGNGVVQFVRNIIDFKIDLLNESKEVNEYTMYVAIIKGNAFLWHQIRYMVSILFLIGLKKEEPSIIQELLNIKANPRKPDYQMANEVPLNLFECDYENVKWNYSQENLTVVSENLRKMWSFMSIKKAMVEDAICSISTQLKYPKLICKCLTENLLTGVKPKKYVPVLKRQKCESLEDKIHHYSKRNRIEIISKNK
ncbi:tRNA pseudouridine(38/39) synthase isoform X2 [Rhynchophorus ferrugineus]|uniref:tRNA pseudouridine(38/39) synthase isoform X2 n=1 Tax=Rhynchophorus ferrugineus TaxID=354439 RepID=UPI003FCC3CD9